MADIFTDDQSGTKPQDADQVSLEDLVGEGKKYKDVNELAKAYVHADKHIEGLNSSLEEVRTELQTRLSVEDALQKLKEKNGEVTTTTEEVVEAASTEGGVTLEQIEELLNNRTAKQTAEANYNSTIESIISYTGSPEAAKTFLKEKAAELETTIEALQKDARERPNFLLKTLGVGKKAEDKTLGVKQVRAQEEKPEANTKRRVSELELNDISALKTEDPHKWMSPPVQKRLLDLKMAKIRAERGL